MHWKSESVLFPNRGVYVLKEEAEAVVAHEVKREREEIVKEVEKWIVNPNDTRIPRELLDHLKARGEKKPGFLRHLCGSDLDDRYAAVSVFNAVVDAVNKLIDKEW